MGTAPKQARKRASVSSPPQHSENAVTPSFSYLEKDSAKPPLKTKHQLRNSDENYRLLFKKNLAGVFVTKINGEIIDCNDSFARMLGYKSPAEMFRRKA